MNLFHAVVAFSSIWLNIVISNVSATGTLVVKSIIESPVKDNSRRRTAADIVIQGDDMFNMATFTFNGTGSVGAVYTKIQSSRRILKSGLEEVIWEGAIIDSNETGFATLLRYDHGPVVASFTTNEAAYELDTTSYGAGYLTSTLWEDVLMGSYVEAPMDGLETAFNMLPTTCLIAAGMSYPDNGGTVTSSTGNAASLVDSTTPMLSRYLQDGPVVDVLVIVTNRAMCRAASLSDGCAFTAANRKPIEDKIVLANQQSNSAVQGVGLSLSFRIVEVIHLLPTFEANPDVAALDVLRLDPNVQSWINAAGADLVAMLTGSIPSGFPAAGIAYLNRPESVTSVDYLSTYTFTHELGK